MFKFIDLFAGLGGFRIALENLGCKCVFSSEINKHACEIYKKNFNENPFCDITTLNPKNIPDFDILCAGFPCQAFSVAGKQKGFEDTRGTLFFDLCRIIEYKKPSFLILENVKNLTTHNNKNTFKTIEETLDNIGYNISYKILNAKDFGVAQSRERIIIVGIKKSLNVKFEFKAPKFQLVKLKDFIFNKELIVDKEKYTILDSNIQIEQKSGLIFCGYFNKNTRNGVKANQLHLSRTHKQNNRIYHINGIHPTLSSQETSGRYYIYDNKNVFKLSLEDCFYLMGFPDSYIKIGAKSNLYNRIGNSVCIPMIQHTAKTLFEQIL